MREREREREREKERERERESEIERERERIRYICTFREREIVCVNYFVIMSAREIRICNILCYLRGHHSDYYYH